MKHTTILTFLIILSGTTKAQIADSAKREVKLNGAVNFRDIGGYPAAGGKTVRWGKLYRSAALNNIGDNGWTALQQLKVARIADFRGPYEVQQAPDAPPAGMLRFSLPAGSENIGDKNYMKTMLAQMGPDSSLVFFYKDISAFKARYRPLFDSLLSMSSDSSLLFHCTAGKDRTGIAAALILYALGVNDSTIMEDYVATNHYREKENAHSIEGMVNGYGMTRKMATNMMLAEPEYLSATFTAIKTKYGSIDRFLELEMGLTGKKRKELQEKFLN